MKTKDFLKKHDACTGSAKWALSIGDDKVVDRQVMTGAEEQKGEQK